MDITIQANGIAKIVSVLSLASLLIEMRFGETKLSTGTAFILEKGEEVYLITNRHNVTGLNQDTKKPLSKTLGVPDRIAIHHHIDKAPGQTIVVAEPLYDANGMPLWLEHPVYGSSADIAALRLTNFDNVHTYRHPTEYPGPELKIGPTSAVSVVGFPFGLTGGGPLAIWATGFVASEPSIELDNQPVFLIDCRTRPGQSGSPVLAYRHAGEMVATTDGRSARAGGNVIRLLGIYSGRINAESDLGRVWKTSAILDTVSFGRRPSRPH